MTTSATRREGALFSSPHAALHRQPPSSLGCDHIARQSPLVSHSRLSPPPSGLEQRAPRFFISPRRRAPRQRPSSSRRRPLPHTPTRAPATSSWATGWVVWGARDYYYIYIFFFISGCGMRHVARATPAGTRWCVWNRAFVCGVRRSGLECGVHAWNSAKRRGIRRKRWNSAKTRGIRLKKWNSGVPHWNSNSILEFPVSPWNSAKRRGIHETAWNRPA